MDESEPSASATYADVDGSRDPAEAAAWMDRLAGWPVFETYKAHIRDLLVSAGGGPWLDVGCGLGNDVRALGPAAVGVDPSWTMLHEAATRGGLFVAGRAERLPFASAAFAGVSADRVLQHLADPEAATAELVRVVRPGGVVVVADPDQATLRIEGPEARLTEVVRQYRADHGIRNGYLAGHMDEVLARAGGRDVERASWTLDITDPADAFGISTWSRFLHTHGYFDEMEAARFDATLALAAAKGRFRYRVDIVVTWGRISRQ